MLLQSATLFIFSKLICNILFILFIICWKECCVAENNGGDVHACWNKSPLWSNHYFHWIWIIFYLFFIFTQLPKIYNVATFKMIAMSSARSASILTMVKSKQTTVTEATLIPPLTNLDPASWFTCVFHMFTWTLLVKK